MSKKENLNFSKAPNHKDWETSTQYVDQQGNKYTKKPEAMTQLLGNLLVPKNDARIIFRGRMDTFQAQLLYYIATHKAQLSLQILEQLRELLQVSREILGAEVLNQEFTRPTMLSWTPDEIRDRSHNTLKYYQLKQMVLLDDEADPLILALNHLRALIREIELCAITAFEGSRDDLVQALNRMSSCFHILIYQELAQLS